MNYFKISRFFILIGLLYVAVVSPGTLFPFIVGKYSWFRVAVDIAAIAFLIGLLRDVGGVMFARIRSVFREPLTIAVSIFVAVFLLAGFLGVDPAMSFFSNFERGEGGLQMLHLYAFFLLLVILFRDEDGWHRLFRWALAGGVLMALYGLCAGLNVGGFIGQRFSEAGFRFQGSIGNPAYVAAFSLFMLFYAAQLFFAKYWRRPFTPGGVTLMVLALAFLRVFFSAATRGAFLGLLAAFIVGVGYFVYAHRAWRKWLIGGMVAVLLLVGNFVYFKDSPFVKSIPGSRIFDLSFTTETFHDRAIMWKIAVDGWKGRPLLGWGPENYIKVFDSNFNTAYFKPSQGFGAWFDRAHSIYFDYLAETGILGLLSFLSIFVLFFIRLLTAWARADRLAPHGSKPHGTPLPPVGAGIVASRAFLLAALVAYLVQGVALFDVLPIYVNVFMVLAFAVNELQRLKER
ncbi:MAG: O-antigen ligase family protein [Candidatus Jorgensenbacteria bacterium]